MEHNGLGYETEGLETLETVRLQTINKVEEKRTNLPKTLCFIAIVVPRFLFNNF
jgi:hypothetical protein